MYAIVDIAGQQFKVAKNNKIFVHRLENEEGSQVSFDKVMLIDNDGIVTLGEPTVNGAAVVAKVVAHVKGDKVLVFKKKRRKGYQKLNGHRQCFSEIVIEEIMEKGYKATAKKAEAAKEGSTEKASTKAAGEKKAEAKKEEAPKKAAPKKEEASEDTLKATTAENKTAVSEEVKETATAKKVSAKAGEEKPEAAKAETKDEKSKEEE
jgi:large subunit ribosomal protein L21